jgi:DNA-directed RNA polymerase subunit H (RpoH/RPB5)
MEETKHNSELWKLYKIRKTVLKTLRDRKYDLPDGIDQLPFGDFVTLHSKNRHHLYFPTMMPPQSEGLVEEDRKGILVYFEANDDFTKKVLEARVSRLADEYVKLARLFFVLKVNGGGKKKPKINAFVANALNKNPEFSYVRILENVYQFDFTENVVLPKCTLLTTQQKEAVLRIYNTELHLFKKITSADPVAKRFGARVGDMFYIERDGGLEIDYRVVVEPGTT